jgi:uncharacterized protein YndB with AHSA1/START domain
MLAFLCASTPASAEVLDATANGFALKISLEVNAASAELFRALSQVSSWWDSSHTWSGSAANLSLDDRAGGCFCEKLPGGGSVQHMTVVFTDGAKTLRLVGSLGPLQALAVTGSMTFTISDQAGKSRLELTYNVGGYAQGGLSQLAPLVDSVLAGQLQRLKNFAERGTP